MVWKNQKGSSTTAAELNPVGRYFNPTTIFMEVGLRDKKLNFRIRYMVGPGTNHIITPKIIYIIKMDLYYSNHCSSSVHPYDGDFALNTSDKILIIRNY